LASRALPSPKGLSRQGTTITTTATAGVRMYSSAVPFHRRSLTLITACFLTSSSYSPSNILAPSPNKQIASPDWSVAVAVAVACLFLVDWKSLVQVRGGAGGLDFEWAGRDVAVGVEVLTLTLLGRGKGWGRFGEVLYVRIGARIDRDQSEIQPRSKDDQNINPSCRYPCLQMGRCLVVTSLSKGGSASEAGADAATQVAMVGA
jgi:hypothetical protein